MTRILKPFVLALLSGIFLSTAIADELDDAFLKVATWKSDDDPAPLQKIEVAVIDALNGKLDRGSFEKKLIAALRMASTRRSRSFLCRQLRIVGTDACIPLLAEILRIPESSHMARYALGSMKTPAARAALIGCLNDTDGAVQIGLIESIGDLGADGAEAIESLRKLLAGAREPTAIAAATALGEIATPDALKALDTRRREATEKLTQKIDSALVMGANRLADRTPNSPVAAAVFEQLSASGEPIHLQTAGLQGNVKTKGAAAATDLILAIQGSNDALRRAAIALSVQISGEEFSSKLRDLFDVRASATQELLIRAFAKRGDRVSRDVIVSQIKNVDLRVRMAAIEALGDIGDSSAVPILAELAATSGGDEQKAARASLIRLPGKDATDRAIVQLLSGAEALSTEISQELMTAAAGRKISAAAPDILRFARSDDDDIRPVAIDALAYVTNETHLTPLLDLVISPASEKDSNALATAVGTILTRTSDSSAKGDALISAWSRTAENSHARITLLSLMPKAATSKTLAVVRENLTATDTRLRDAAVSSLSDWPAAGAADDLLTLAKSDDNPDHAVLGLKGYIRLAPMLEKPEQALLDALDLATRPDEVRQALSGLASTGTARSLNRAIFYLDDDAVRNEAAVAATRIAQGLIESAPDRAKTTFERVVAIEKIPGWLRRDANKGLEKLPSTTAE